MNTNINIGLIECGSKPHQLYVSPLHLEGHFIKKILSSHASNEVNIKSRYPTAEIVASSRDILDDHSIDLVIVTDPSQDDMGLVGEAIQAGKQIRII